ncbi:MAG: chemotaxis protein MotB [Thermodesulfobacteriota bacterium]|nr:chemotaxis protein MotB [Thermodesulfobacteriota bacterium]
MGARKTGIEKYSDRETGMVLTVSTFLILLAFFILLCSLSITDLKKKQAVSKSLSGSFGGFTGGSPGLNTKNQAQEDINQGASGSGNLDDLLSGMDDSAAGSINLKTGKSMQILVIGESALFQPYRHKLKPGSIPLLKKLGDHIRTGKYRLEIAGHTDNRDAEEKGYRSNHELSSLMALQIQKYLIEESGVEPERIMAYGCGSERPDSSDDTEESREKNRRIEIIVKSKSPDGFKWMHIEPPRGNFSYKGFNFRIYSNEKKSEK